MISIGIADDDALVRRTLTQLLSASGEISIAWVARDGEEALELWRSPDSPPVEAVLLDVQMPGLDGLALAEILHREDPDLAILILTTFIADPIVDKAMAVGVRGFVAKEDPVTSLADTIRQAVEGNLVLSPRSSAIVSDHFRRMQLGSPSTNEAPVKTSPQATEQLPHGVTLSPRELEVLALISEALTNRQIARRLGVSEATVKTHVSMVISKLGVQDRVGAAVYALKHDLV